MTIKTSLQQLAKAFDSIESMRFNFKGVEIITNDDLLDTKDFVGNGVFRSVYTTTSPKWVVKIPHGFSGAEQTIKEAMRFALLEPYGLAPKHKLMYVNGFPVLYVEPLSKFSEYDPDRRGKNDMDYEVLDLVRGKIGIRDWTQTGVTKDGRRVFSDLGH